MLRLTLSLALAASFAFDAPALAQDLDAAAAAARANRRDADAQRAYGRALLRAGRFREAERALQQAARLRDNSLEALYELATVAFAQDDYRKSRAACRRLEREERNAVLTRVCRARAFLVWNRSGRAFEELEAAQAADGDHFEVELALGDANRLRHRVDEAEAAYRRAIAIDATRFEPHLGLGLLYAGAERDADALAAFRRAQELDGEVPEVQYELGIRTGGAEGKRLLTRAVAARRGWVEALVALADLEREAGESDAARERYEAALERDERNAAAHIGLGKILVAAGEAEEGEAALRRALEIVPNSADVALALGELFESQERWQDAFGQYRHAANVEPRNPEGLLHAARLALRRNRDVLATGYLDRLLQTHPNLSAGLALYGDAMKARGDRAQARSYYQRALRGQGDVDRERIQRSLRELDQPQQRGRRIHRATAP
ncbi:MAG TPA: tetratricopeptide repeat protein [Polyangiaceae bacterium LLY-WYZ-15_(1-7)]|nr:hypothetical protein [Sandaracinus sp.]HJK93669.1 tetratricopeptide repeat protein [Polyangiaceae bacterium LLY-WYZ-15_(1-7)]MBJ71479.1 hypothetical protein [Sandaracinus sp.]HJL03635.1 tetratricopeptide repeat protein [Polyangiaceae bacterium LLY-WYZ-15_(1-7)]HJL12720.1 tetratricopeptide repeat protein [Polyangiaceae bacterium LLY-WYZ-15_(1-7)]